ncbi:MAG: hypothetical protein Q9203_003243 [Teloschistes exilis]
MPAKIPGYVYDEGKRKYFKILPDHAVPSASSYSRTAVAEGERRKEHLLVREELHQRKLRQQVQRSVILSLHPLGGFIGVQREHGSHEGRIATAKAQIWAKGLSQKTLTARSDPFPPLRNPSGAIRHFVHEPNTGAIISAPDWTGIRRALSSLELYVPVLTREATPLTFKRYHMDHARSIGLGTSPEISSLSISPDCVVLATALGREQPPTLHTIQMKPALQVEGRDDRPHIATTIANIDLSGAIRRSGFNTVWASAAGPHQGDYNEFAVGTSNGVLHFRVGGDRCSEQESRWPGDEHSADTFAVDFWGSSSVLAGMRSGKVRLWDTRSQGANVRFQHASCVVDIKTLDQHRILVAGLKNKVC